MKKFTTLKPVIIGHASIPAGRTVELDEASSSTKALLARKHIEPAKAEKAEKPEKPPGANA